MPVPILTKDEVMNRMNSHRVEGSDAVKIDRLRTDIINLTLAAVDIVPAGREGSLMVTHLEEALMWGVKAIATAQRP